MLKIGADADVNSGLEKLTWCQWAVTLGSNSPGFLRMVSVTLWIIGGIWMQDMVLGVVRVI